MFMFYSIADVQNLNPFYDITRYFSPAANDRLDERALRLPARQLNFVWEEN